MANQVGKRYTCKKCGSEFIVTRPGEGTLFCCGQPMELKKQFPLKGHCAAQGIEAIPDSLPRLSRFARNDNRNCIKELQIIGGSDI